MVSRSTVSLLVVLGFGFSEASAWSATSIIRERSPSFRIDRTILDSGDIQSFYELIDPNLKPISLDDSFNQTHGKSEALHFFSDLDLNQTWANRSKNKYYLSSGKVAYLVSQDIRFFSPARACSIPGMKIMGPDLGITQLGECHFRLAPDGMSPGTDFTIKRYLNNSLDPAPEFLFQFDSDLGRPDVTDVQINSNFTRVLLMKTVKEVVVVTHYYRIKNNQTLVVSYNRSVIFNVPPLMAGGADRIRRELELQLPLAVNRLRAYSGK